MDDDFNTADALAAMYLNWLNLQIQMYQRQVPQNLQEQFLNNGELCDVLGLEAVKKEEILDKEIEDLIAERQEARKAKNFARADEIRDELLAKGIILKDTREGSKMETELK